MKYPVVDRRALGGASVFGGPVAPKAPPSAPRRLGQAVQAALDITKAEYEKAKTLNERIRVNYPNLVAIIGQEKANQAVQQAQAGLAAALRAYNDSVEVAQ